LNSREDNIANQHDQKEKGGQSPDVGCCARVFKLDTKGKGKRG